jgi:hypothetical protein
MTFHLSHECIKPSGQDSDLLVMGAQKLRDNSFMFGKQILRTSCQEQAFNI